MNLPQDIRIGYVPLTTTMQGPGDQRRFLAYALERGLKFEIAKPSERYDLVVLSELADISVWCDYSHGKILYDLTDSYLAVPRSDWKQWLRGPVWFFFGRYRRLQVNHWKAIRSMCNRADAVVCTTKEQRSDILPNCVNVHIILDVHDFVSEPCKDDYRGGMPFNLVWEGLPSNLYQLRLLTNVLKEVNKVHPIVLNIITDLDFPRFMGRFGRVKTQDIAGEIFDFVKIHPWSQESWSRVVRECDLAVIPINLDDPFVSGKPENKLILFWRMGIPVITSATPAYMSAMDGAKIKGFTCSDELQWVNKLIEVIQDETCRREVGAQGRLYSEVQYSKPSIIKKWDTVFSSIGFNFNNL
jgi:glycosyltransferase involved in cell wall biosynthesis